MSRDWVEREHPRRPSGDEHGGEFRELEPWWSVPVLSPRDWAAQAAARVTGGWRAWSRGELHALVQAGAEPVGKISGGEMAHTQMMRHPGGHVTVHKTYPAILHGRAENEVAVGLVAEAIGAPYPAVVPDPDDPNAIFMQYVDADVTDSGLPTRREYSVDLRTDDALLLGFLDVLTANGDRNGGNYIRTPGGRVVGIDGGEAFLTSHKLDGDGTARPPGMRVPGFTPRFFKMSPWLGRMEWRDNDLSPADIDAARPRLEDLRRMFTQMGMDRAYEQMMERFEAMAAHAAGTERKLPI